MATSKTSKTSLNSRTDIRSDDELALGWLKRRLEWEQILGELRDLGRGGRTQTSPRRQEPAAA